MRAKSYVHKSDIGAVDALSRISEKYVGVTEIRERINNRVIDSVCSYV